MTTPKNESVSQKQFAKFNLPGARIPLPQIVATIR